MKKIIICAAFVAALACFFAVPCMAAYSEDIFYNSVYSAVQVNENGTANVTMRLEAMMPANGEEIEINFYGPYTINSFAVKNFTVTGTTTCSTEVEGDDTKVKLGGVGSAGAQSFTLTYDVEFKNDLEEGFDWFDIDFFLNRLRGDIDRFSAEITCPDTAKVQSWAVLDDLESGKEFDDIDALFENNVFKLTSTEKIRSYDNAVLHVTCDTGVFSQLPEPAVNNVIQKRVCTVAVNPEMVYTVNERMTIQANGNNRRLLLPVLEFADYKTSYQSELVFKSVKVAQGENGYDDKLNLYVDTGGEASSFDVEYTYTVRPVSIDTPIEVRIEGGYSDRVEDMTLNFTAPGMLEADVRVYDSVLAYAQSSERIEVIKSGDILTITLKKPLYDYEAVSIAVRHNPSLYARKGDFLVWLLPISAVLCLIACILMKALFGMPSPLKGMRQMGVPTPPGNMTSAEIGYLKDGVLTAEELSTLVLKWVAMDAVTAQECDGEYILTLRAMPQALADWEQALLHALFSKGNGVHVTTVQLRGKLDEIFATAQQAVQRQYQGELALQAGGAGQWLCMAVAALPLLLLGVLSALEGGWGLLLGIGVGIGCMAVQLLLSCLWLPVCKRRTGALVPPVKSITQHDALFVLLLLGGAAVYTAVLKNLFPFLSVAAAAFTILVCLAAALAGALFLRRRPMAQALLSEVHGFYHALASLRPQTMRDGQRQSQRWCYEMLPYAMVLGLMNEWKSAAKGADVPAPCGMEGAQDFNEYAEHAQRLVAVLKRCAGMNPLR